MGDSNSGYAATRFSFDKRRSVLWSVLAPYLQRRFSLTGCILDVGCGYGDFISNVDGDRRYALDQNRKLLAHLAPDIVSHEGGVERIREFFANETMDVIFNSNLLEHLERDAIQKLLRDIHAILKPGGRLVTLMPNYRFATAEYFDDYTHVTPISHVGLSDWLRSCGFDVEFCHPKFMPFSIKSSRIPVTAFLIKMWLILPFKWSGKQMLIVAKRKP